MLIIIKATSQLPRLGFWKLSCNWKTTFSTKCWMSQPSGPRTNTVHSCVKPSGNTLLFIRALCPNSNLTWTPYTKYANKYNYHNSHCCIGTSTRNTIPPATGYSIVHNNVVLNALHHDVSYYRCILTTISYTSPDLRLNRKLMVMFKYNNKKPNRVASGKLRDYQNLAFAKLHQYFGCANIFLLSNSSSHLRKCRTFSKPTFMKKEQF